MRQWIALLLLNFLFGVLWTFSIFSIPEANRRQRLLMIITGIPGFIFFIIVYGMAILGVSIGFINQLNEKSEG